jgi:hypothetical protein
MAFLIAALAAAAAAQSAHPQWTPLQQVHTAPVQPTQTTSGPPLVVAQPLTPIPTSTMTLPSNTEVTLRMNDELTSKSARVGTEFNLSVAEDVIYQNYVVIPRGTRGVGEVTWLTGRGAFGKSGKMEIQLRYLEIGGRHVSISGKYRQEGEGNTVATIGAVIAVGVFGGFVTGHSAVIPEGRELKAYTDEAISFAAAAPVQVPIQAAVVGVSH